MHCDPFLIDQNPEAPWKQARANFMNNIYLNNLYTTTSIQIPKGTTEVDPIITTETIETKRSIVPKHR